MPEALVAATLNAAASLGKSATHGSLEVGKLADMVVIDAPRYTVHSKSSATSSFYKLYRNTTTSPHCTGMGLQIRDTVYLQLELNITSTAPF